MLKTIATVLMFAAALGALTLWKPLLALLNTLVGSRAAGLRCCIMQAPCRAAAHACAGTRATLIQAPAPGLSHAGTVQ